MTSEGYKSLSSVKEQVEKMFHAINNLESKEKNEAFGYLRKYLDGENLDTRKDTIHKITSDNSNNVKAIRLKQTTSTEKRTRRCTRNNNWKMKFKNQIPRVKRPSLKCRTCGERSKTKKLLLKHLETHIGTPISCRHCKIGFNCRTSYFCHISLKMCKINKTIVKKYICDQCQKAFRFKRHFERHVEGHKRNNCTYCDTRLTRRKQLVHHLSTVHSIKLERAIMFKCEHCEKRYVKKRSLYHHLKQHAEDKIVCMECGTLSATVQEHAEHFAAHDKDRPWKCEKCSDSFSRRQQYLIHMKRHDRYKCVTCNETFASKARVLRHKQRGHTVQGLEPQMKCPHCPMAFQRRLSLQIHMRKHLDDKIVYCKYCDKNFRSPYLYFKHCTTTVHDINSPEKRQLVCDLCGKLFVKKYQLEQHLHRVHDNTKQVYTCEYCGHKTTNRVNMDRHLSLHLEDKKEIICDQCGKAFYNITTLKDHIAYVHSQERHFKCNECDKAFKRNSELVRHKTSHSDLRPHVCETCGVSYKRSTHLRRHEESQHGTTTKNRRVQRLTKDENGQLVPVPEQKKSKPKTKKKSTPVPTSKQVFSIMDAQSGEMVTFTLPQVSNETVTTVLNINNQSFGQDVLQTNLPYQQTNVVLNPTDNIILASELPSQPTANNLVTSVDQTFTNQLIDNGQFTSTQVANSSYLPTNILPASVQIQNSTTCDILLPENRILNQQSEQNPPGNYSQDTTYQFLYYD